MKYLISGLLYMAYVILKSVNDGIYIEKEKAKGVNHSIEWLMVAICASLCGMVISSNWINILLFDFALVPLTWVIMDWFTNLYLNENPWTYIGSGFWDEFFKLHFKGNAIYAIWICKIILTIAAWYVYVEFLIRN